MSKPILLLDQDGPLADFERYFFARCQEQGFTLDCTFEEQIHRFATDHIPDQRERRAARAMVNAAGWFRQLPVTPGAQEGIWGLSEHFDVWICTKPLEVNPTCRDDKAHWIAEHFGSSWLNKLIVTPDKSMINGDILLDDAPKSRWLDCCSWQPVIFATTYNGDGSAWSDLPRWNWNNNVEELLQWTSISMT